METADSGAGTMPVDAVGLTWRGQILEDCKD